MLCVGEVQPDVVRHIISLIIVKWVQCDKCEHLMFYTDVRVMRTGTGLIFLCPLSVTAVYSTVLLPFCDNKRD